MTKSAPYGSWKSPITSDLIVAGMIGLGTLVTEGDVLYWMEFRPAEKGRNTIVRRDPDGVQTDLLPPSYNARTRVHEYGGASYQVANGVVFFSNFSDQRLYRLDPGQEPVPLTPGVDLRYADIEVDARRGRLVCVREDHTQSGREAVNTIVSLDWNGRDLLSGGQVLASGHDFFSTPRLSPDGAQLVWLAWDHPNMPWDGTRVMLVRLQPAAEGQPPRLVDVQQVGGGPEMASAQPLFSPDGRWLSFIEEQGEWPALVLFDLQTGQRENLLDADGCELCMPAWVQGGRSTGWSPDGRRLYYIRHTGVRTSLWYIDLPSRVIVQIDTEPYAWVSQLAVAPQGEGLAFLGSAPDVPDQVVRWDGQRLIPVANSLAATYDPAVLPEAREIQWQVTDSQSGEDVTVYGVYYPPHNPAFTCDGPPPAILHIHGGPTSLSSFSFMPTAAYFTSRGYAFVAVNYRGSTGYGRSYRNALRQRWGEVDVDDTAACARALAEQNLADPRRLVIMGGSAGGYTVLNALIRHPGLFKAGVCLYGVSNLFTLDLDTHKFEAHYTTSMVGKLPEAAGRYHAWSPVFHAHNIRDALYIFQGSDDKVVPPSQSEEIVAILKARGIPYQYKLYEGEGHGFRKSETIADYLKETERFLQQNVLFAP
jgi:dipeptidyl aminopeptidase/acylaminoacyl peptidase